MSVSVKDSGIGIAAEELPNLFGMFYQVDIENVRSHDGLGIGLALARRLTELHGGTIQARSDGIGNGSEFVVALPLANEELTGRQFPHSGVTTNQLLHSEFAKRILVVDDSGLQTQSMSKLMSLLGYNVRVAHDGPSALNVVAEFLPGIAMIDIGLPGMSGYELARRIREMAQGKNILLIAQTGWGREEDRQKSLQAGFDHHLTKPINHQLLGKFLNEAGVAEQRVENNV